MIGQFEEAREARKRAQSVAPNWTRNVKGVSTDCRQHEHSDLAAYRSLLKHSEQLDRRLANVYENITRVEFGFRKIGEAWVSESMLFNIVSRLFPDEPLIRHHRPDWLEGLELDIYVPSRGLAFEYQGQQHFHPIRAWGGPKALEAMQVRDARKRQICEQSNCDLIAIDYTEPLTEQHVADRIGSAIVDGCIINDGLR